MAGTIKHSWNGSILTITSDSGTSSCNLLGPKGDDGPRGIVGPAGGNLYKVYQAAHNILDNSCFSNVVNQRGAATYTGTAYSIDRWYGRAIAQTVAVRSTDITITASGTSYIGLKQKVENITQYRGKTLTLACRLYSTAIPAVYFANNTDTSLAKTRGAAGKTQTILVSFTVPSDATTDNFIPSIMMETAVSGDYMRLYWAALYEGEYNADSLPTYQPKGYAAEMAECKRYHRVVDGSAFVGFMTTSSAYMAVQTEIPMRKAVPTLVMVEQPENCLRGGGMAINPTSITATANTGNSISIKVQYDTQNAAVNQICILSNGVKIALNLDL